MRLYQPIADLSSFQHSVVHEATQRRGLMPQASMLHVLITKPREVAGWCLRRLAGDFDPVPEQVITVRKIGHGVRPVAELFIRDQLLYRTLVNAWSKSLVEPPHSAQDFEEFEYAPLRVASTDYVLSSDITAFYQYIDYDLLGRELIARTGDATRVDLLIELLSKVTGRRYSLPQQNSSSDWLANAYIDVLERRLIRRGLQVWRYNDDFRVAVASWSDALAAIDLLDREARSIGLALNDAKTVIRKRATYEATINRREAIRREIAEAAELDLTDVFATPYDEIQIEPDPKDVQVAAATRVLQRWARHEESDPMVEGTLVQLIPYALANLSASSPTNETLRTCMELLRTEQTVTPAVAQYLTNVRDDDQDQVLASFTDFLDDNPYITPWQAAWLAPPMGGMSKFTAGQAGEGRGAWLRSVWDDARAPEPVLTAVAEALARHKLLDSDELLQAYDAMSETSRPAIAAAIGVAGLSQHSMQGKALAAEDDLIRWLYEWGIESS